MTRIYQPTTMTPHTTMQLNVQASHHLAHVLRANINDTITLFNGQGGEYTAIITHIDKKTVTIAILDFVACNRESTLNIFLAQGIARGEKMDFIIQKAVELGVKKIIPLITERCNVRLADERTTKRLQHWQAIIINACEQSGRHVIPEISMPVSLMSWLSQIKIDYGFLLSPHTAQKFQLATMPSNASVAILIGPEGGLTATEVNTARQNKFIPLNLGPRILRTETAAIAAISILQFIHGDAK